MLKLLNGEDMEKKTVNAEARTAEPQEQSTRAVKTT